MLCLYMYILFICILIDRCCCILFMIKDYLNRSVLFWGYFKWCLVFYLLLVFYRDVYLYM